MIPVGSLINGAAIVVGALLGLLLHGRFPDRVRVTMFQALGLAIMLIGLKMALAMTSPILVVVSMLVGAVCGEACDIERHMARAGDRIKAVFHSKNALFTDGLVTASVVFCTGTMAILGPFDEALRGDRTLLYTKAMLDGSIGLIFASTHGAGVILSFVPVLLYQGLLTFAAAGTHAYFTPDRLTQLTAVGGLLILAIGLNMLGLVRIKVSNLLPAIVVAVVLAPYFAA
jgi:uncharacterized membrane protein YqgA involved in biofilm formation